MLNILRNYFFEPSAPTNHLINKLFWGAVILYSVGYAIGMFIGNIVRH